MFRGIFDDFYGTKQGYLVFREYEVEEKIGLGSYSQVYKGIGKATNEKVAIKKSKSISNVRRLQAEYEMLMLLSHPSIIKVFDFKVDEFTNTAYMIMEHFDGVPADEYLLKYGQADDDDLLSFL